MLYYLKFLKKCYFRLNYFTFLTLWFFCQHLCCCTPQALFLLHVIFWTCSQIHMPHILSSVSSLSFKIESQLPPLIGFLKCPLLKFLNTSLYDLLPLGPHIWRSSLTCNEAMLSQAPEATHLNRKAYKTSVNCKLRSWLLCQEYLLINCWLSLYLAVFHLLRFSE